MIDNENYLTLSNDEDNVHNVSYKSEIFNLKKKRTSIHKAPANSTPSNNILVESSIK